MPITYLDEPIKKKITYLDEQPSQPAQTRTSTLPEIATQAISKVPRIISPITNTLARHIPEIAMGGFATPALHPLQTAQMYRRAEMPFEKVSEFVRQGVNTPQVQKFIPKITEPLKMIPKLGFIPEAEKQLQTETIAQTVAQPVHPLGVAAGMAGATSKGVRGAVEGLTGLNLPKRVPRNTKLIQEVTGEMRTMLRPTQGEVKNIEIRRGKNIDDFYTLAAEEQLPITQTKDKKLDTTTAREKIQTKLDTIDDELMGQVKSDTQRRFDLEDIRQQALKEAKEVSPSGKQYKDTVDDINDYIDNEIAFRGNRRLTGEELVKFKRGMWKEGYNVMRPTADKTARKLGHIAKETIEIGYPKGNIKNLNELSGKYATLLHLLQNAQGRVVSGGMMGRYFARTIGAIAGSKVGPLGSVAGQYAGGKIADLISSPQRISSMVAKKAKRAGIVDKSYGEVMKPPRRLK